MVRELQIRRSNYETKSSYSLIVKAIDSSSNLSTLAVIVNITDIKIKNSISENIVYGWEEIPIETSIDFKNDMPFEPSEDTDYMPF